MEHRLEDLLEGCPTAAIQNDLVAPFAGSWRCADSLALRTFLGISVTESTPVHASMSVIRKRLSPEAFQQVFVFVLNLLRERGLVRGKALGIDATTLEANAAMKSIVRKDGGDGWKDYLRKLAAAEGNENPTDDDLRRLDRRRPGKKVSNEDWVSAGGQNRPVVGGSKPATGEVKFLAEAAALAAGSRVEHPHRERTTVHSNPCPAGMVPSADRPGTRPPS